MEFVIYGVDFKNAQGEFCPRRSSEYFFFSHFRTDYLYECAGKLLPGRAGDMMLIPPGGIIYHGPTSGSEEGFANDWLYVGGDDLAALLERYPIPTGVPFRAGGRLHLARAVERIHKELSFRHVGYSERCDLIMAEAVIEIYRAYLEGDRVDSGLAAERVRGEMRRDCKRQWTLEALCRISGYSPSRLSAVYKSRFGISPINDLINIRMEQAKRLLIYSSSSVGEVAEEVGFSSIYYFSKLFKRREGVSPQEYRKEMRDTSGASE